MNFIGSFYERYLNLGFAVVPIKTLAYSSLKSTGADREAKTPLVAWEPFQKRFPTHSEIDAWAKQWPSAGIAVVTGLQSDALALDDDRSKLPPLRPTTEEQRVQLEGLRRKYQHYGSLEQVIAASHELYEKLMELKTARSRTARGKHFWFRMPRNDDGTPMAVGTKVGFLPGWDVRADGGYVIVPPSIHSSGASYVWENAPEDVDLIELPKWALETIERLPGLGKTLPALSTPKQTWDISAPVVEGFRNDTLAKWFGGQFRSPQFYREENWPQVLEWAKAINLAYMSPPMDEDELTRTFVSISKAERSRRGTDTETLNRYYVPGSEAELVTAAELGIVQLSAPGYAIRDFILDGTTQLFGKPKAGKSWFALQMAVAVATGQPLFQPTASMYAFADHPQGFDSQQGDVLYLALEDSLRRLQSRTREVTGTQELPARLTFATHWKNLHDGGLTDIELWLDNACDPRLVVIDPLAAFVGAGTRSEGSVFRAEYRMFRPIWELGQLRKVPIVIVDHASKAKGKFLGSGDPFDSGAGTLGSQAAVDTVMILEHADKGPYARITFKGRDIERGHLDLEHSSKSPLWKIATVSVELAATTDGKRANGASKPSKSV